MKRCLIAVFLLASIGVRAQTETRVPIHVAETGGIRRSTFPVTARVPLPRGALSDAAHAKLVLNDADVPAQMTAASRWPDGSIQWLDADFSSSPGPGETLNYALVYGPAVQPPAIGRGLTVTEDATSVQVGNIRFSKSGMPLLASVKYRDEAIGSGVNGLVVVDRSGVPHDLASAEGMTLTIGKRGPLLVQLVYTGTLPLDGTRAPFVLTAEMPSSKSWVKLSAAVTDPAGRVRDVLFHTPLALGPAPWVWDFGTTRWTYGALRGPTDEVVMNHVARSATEAEWTVFTASNGREQQVYETSRPDNATFAGWGHVQGAKEVVAFAIERPGTVAPGNHRITISGGGSIEFRFAPSAPQTRHTLTVYQHYVGTPVQIGAATSPAAIITPLTAVCDRDQYVKSGVPVAPGAR